MLVHKKTKKLVLNLTDPSKVLSVIPTAKSFNLQDKELVAVPHRLEEVRVLRNMNIDAPGPMPSYYDWKGVYKPYEHQAHTSDFLTLNPHAFVLNDMGTGKTMSVMWAYDYLLEQGLVDALVVICPLSTMEPTWGEAVFTNFSSMTYVCLHGTAKQRLRMMQNDHQVYVINHDGIKSADVLEGLIDLMKRKRCVLAIDELASFRNTKTERWSACNKLARLAAYVWGLTGTPMPNEPTDVYGQIRLVNPNAIGPSFIRFRDLVMRKVTDFKWLPKPDALDTAYAAMRPAIRYSREDCIDLPPTTFMTRTAPLTPEQDKAYKSMMADMLASVGEDQITAFNEAAKAMKLVQICCGSVYDESGRGVNLPFGPRISAVQEIAEQAGAKVIVFVPFTAALERVADELRCDEYHVEVVHGATPKAERDRIFSSFQNIRRREIIVANAAAMSHGVTLTAANVIIWFGPITSAEIYAQANARIVRPGQKRPTLIVNISGTRTEDRMYARLEGRLDAQERLLGMF